MVGDQPEASTEGATGGRVNVSLTKSNSSLMKEELLVQFLPCCCLTIITVPERPDSKLSY